MKSMHVSVDASLKKLRTSYIDILPPRHHRDHREFPMYQPHRRFSLCLPIPYITGHVAGHFCCF